MKIIIEDKQYTSLPSLGNNGDLKIPSNFMLSYKPTIAYTNIQRWLEVTSSLFITKGGAKAFYP